MYIRSRIPLASVEVNVLTSFHNATCHSANISLIKGNRECARRTAEKEQEVHRLDKFVLPTRAMIVTYYLSDFLIFSTKE